MILLAGIPTEGPMALVKESLDNMGANYRMLDQRDILNQDISMSILGAEFGGQITGKLDLGDEIICLQDVRSIYLRLMDDRCLPEIVGLDEKDPKRSHSRHFHDIIYRWSDIAQCRVLNRPSDMASNQSKPYQAHIIREFGFDVPETLITNDPESARSFIEKVWDEKDSVIYKSLSGVRSIVEKVKQKDFDRLDLIRWCPTQFQRCVRGTDIRVHTVGEKVFAAEIQSEATDYRYATRQSNTAANITSTELDQKTKLKCVALSQALKLPLSGIDLRLTPEGDYFCFEVNPSPAYSYYERHTKAPISKSIAQYLVNN